MNKAKSIIWRTILRFGIIVIISAVIYFLWSPGKYERSGRHDLRANGIWIQHGWLGDDQWFARNNKDKTVFRDAKNIDALADLLDSHGIRYVYPHVSPSNPNGIIAAVDPVQTKRFLDRFDKFKVVPWVGGVFHKQCFPESPQWRKNFISSSVNLLKEHPRLAGLHVNIEPMPSGNKDFLIFLKELREALPKDKILSIAAYPPSTLLHPFPDVHWNKEYFQQISRIADQMVVMMYDTGLKLPKAYQWLMSRWTAQVLAWGVESKILLGIPCYDDPGVQYHFSTVENLSNGLQGIHAGLARHKTLPTNYQGVAIYCEWEMDDSEWKYFKKEFEATQ